MATGVNRQELSTCSICLGCLIKPRKLRGCFHTFCENCLLTYITNLKSNEQDSCEFQCPNCRRQIRLPESTEDLQNWVKSLDVPITDDKMASEQSSKEMSEIGGVCVSCRDIEASVPAKIYCIDCEESLCERCSKIRHRTKMMKEHSIFDLQQGIDVLKDEKQKKLIRVLTELLKCSKHPDKSVSAVCKDDNSLCCTNCVVENHRHCDHIVDLHTCSKSIRPEIESTVKKTKERLEELVTQVDALVCTRKDNITDTKQKAEMVIDKVKEIRSKINNLFDALEENIGSKVKSLSKKYAIETEDEVVNLKEMRQSLKDHISILEHALSLLSGSQTYITSRKLELKLEEAENKVLEANKHSRKCVFDLNIKPALQTILDLSTNNIDKLAEVTETFENTIVRGVAEEPQRFQRGVEKVAEHYIRPENAPSAYSEYYGLIYIRDPRATRRMFLVSPYKDFCCSVDNNYKATECFNKEFLTGKPYGLTELKHNIIAVSLPENKKIVFFSENEESKHLEIVGLVNTRFQPKALCGLNNDELAVSWNEPVGFGILSFKCCLIASRFKERIYFVNDGAGRSLKTFDFMAVDENRSHVIQPCTEDKAVYSFDFEGNPMFKYTHEDLVFPRGVGISGDGNIFVCDQEQIVIHIISPVGQGLHVVREGCPENPLAFAFDPSGLQFAVSQNTGLWNKVRFFRLT